MCQLYVTDLVRAVVETGTKDTTRGRRGHDPSRNPKTCKGAIDLHVFAAILLKTCDDRLQEAREHLGADGTNMSS